MLVASPCSAECQRTSSEWLHVQVVEWLPVQVVEWLPVQVVSGYMYR